MSGVSACDSVKSLHGGGGGAGEVSKFGISHEIGGILIGLLGCGWWPAQPAGTRRVPYEAPQAPKFGVWEW